MKFINFKNWRMILLISGITMTAVNYVVGLIFPFGWKYTKCPPLTCDYLESFGYEDSLFYGAFYTLSFLLIVIGGSFLLGKFISDSFKNETETNQKSEPIISFQNLIKQKREIPEKLLNVHQRIEKEKKEIEKIHKIK